MVIRALQVLLVPEKIRDPEKVTLRQNLLLRLLETNGPFVKNACPVCMKAKNRQTSVYDTCVDTCDSNRKSN